MFSFTHEKQGEKVSLFSQSEKIIFHEIGQKIPNYQFGFKENNYKTHPITIIYMLKQISFQKMTVMHYLSI